MHFAHLARRKDLTGRSWRGMPGEYGSPPVPRGFDPVIDALRAGGDVRAAALESGRDLAGDGVPLDEVLADLEATYAVAGADQPDYQVVRDLCLAWTEMSMRYLHGLSCDDPLTGLASLAHLRSRLDEIYREAEVRGMRVADERALVVVEADRVARQADGSAEGRSASVTRRFGSALRMAEAADALRAVFSGGETLARSGVHRAVALVRRQGELAAQVEALRVLLMSRSEAGIDRRERRVWIEGLPSSRDAASVLLDELAR